MLNRNRIFVAVFFLVFVLLAARHAGNESLAKTPQQAAKPARASASSRSEIVLPDIFITLPADTIAALKKQLEKAEQELRQLERERGRLRKTLEQLEKRSFKGANPPAQRTTKLLGRPSV